MYGQTSFLDLLSATSSPVSEAGQSRFALQGGRITVQYGRAHALVSLSARQAKGLGVMTNVTSGQRGSGSSSSVALTQSLASKLATRLPKAGGMMWPQTWKQRATPAGRQYCQLAVSASRPKGTGSGLWQTPVVDDSVNRVNGKYNSRGEPKLSGQALWATPKASEAEKDSRTPEGALTEVMRGKSP